MDAFELLKDHKEIDKIKTLLIWQAEKITQLESDINRLRDELYGLKDRLYDEQIL